MKNANKMILTIAGMAAVGLGTQVNAHADSYQIKSGDTLSSIAQAHNTSVAALANLNAIDAANIIVAGTDIQIDSPVSSTNASVYTVQAGDTLSKIASANNTDVSSLASLNNISDSNLIYVGEELQLQATATVTPTVASSVAIAPASTSTTTNVSTTSVAPVATTQANVTTNVASTTTTSAASGSTYAQFMAAGGTQALWDSIVMPESGGNPNATNGQYHGLGQTNQSWGSGSVANQTSGLVNYAVSRYGSVDNAISFRQANGWW